jgi:hypothetical protein
LSHEFKTLAECQFSPPPEDKRVAIQKLGETGDAKAIERLRKARAERRSLLGVFFLSTGGNGCVLKDIDAALTALGAPPPPPSRRRRR